MASEGLRRLIALLVVVAAMGAQSLVTQPVVSDQSDGTNDFEARLLAVEASADVSPSD